MKKSNLIRILCFLLLLAMLMPLAVACKDDPPAGGGGGGEGSGSGEGSGGGSGSGEGSGGGDEIKYISVKQTGTEEVALTDFASSNDPNVTKLVTDIHGKISIKWTASYSSNLTVSCPEQINNGGYYYYVEFSVYSEYATNTVFEVRLSNCKTAQKVKLDFTGWKTYRIRTEEFSVVNPYPTVTSVNFAFSEGVQNSIAYISDIKLTRPIYELVVPEGIDPYAPAIYDEITENLRTYLSGNPEGSTNATYNNVIHGKQRNNGLSNWSLYKQTYNDGALNGLFGLTIYENGVTPVQSRMSSVYEYTYWMAVAYATKGAKDTYHNPELLKAIINCLEYGYTYCYGKEFAETGDTPDDNWYEWDASIPKFLCQTLILIQKDITQEQINKYLAPHNTLCDRPIGAASNRLLTGRNIIMSAALQKDPLKLAIANELLLLEVFEYIDEIPDDAPRTNGDGGFYSDGSFIQHGTVAYTASYGMVQLSSMVDLAQMTQGTPFELRGKNVDHQYEWLFDAYRPIIYDDSVMACTYGRQISDRTMERQYVRSMISIGATMRSYAPDELKPEFDSMIKYMIKQLDDHGVEWVSAVPLPFIEYCLELQANESIAVEGNYLITKVFRNMDRVVHHGVKYGVAISLSSTRITKYESINGANEYGWYQGDGMIYIYTDGYDYGFHHFWYADPYLQPGTTVNLAPRAEKNIHPMIFNSDPFAGGVEHGKYGAAGFILGYPESAYKISGSNTFESLEATKITAKKSYFMFDNEIVCIGSDINDYSGKDVITVVENRLWGLNWGKDGWDFSKTDLYIDGELINAPATAQTTISARTMYFENMGGYLFLDQNSAQLSYRKSTRRIHPTVTADDGTSFDFLEITLNHGKGNGNVNGKYAYLYLPEATPEQTESYANDPDVALIRRTGSSHAVLEKKLGILGCIFFDAESFNVNNTATDVKRLASETPCALMISKNEAGEHVISISDPTQTYQTVTLEIEIEGISEIVSKDSRINVNADGNTLYIVFNAKDSRGETFNITVK